MKNTVMVSLLIGQSTSNIVEFVQQTNKISNMVRVHTEDFIIDGKSILGLMSIATLLDKPVLVEFQYDGDASLAEIRDFEYFYDNKNLT